MKSFKQFIMEGVGDPEPFHFKFKETAPVEPLLDVHVRHGNLDPFSEQGHRKEVIDDHSEPKHVQLTSSVKTEPWGRTNFQTEGWIHDATPDEVTQGHIDKISKLANASVVSHKRLYAADSFWPEKERRYNITHLQTNDEHKHNLYIVGTPQGTGTYRAMHYELHSGGTPKNLGNFAV